MLQEKKCKIINILQITGVTRRYLKETMNFVNTHHLGVLEDAIYTLICLFSLSIRLCLTTFFYFKPCHQT